MAGRSAAATRPPAFLLVAAALLPSAIRGQGLELPAARLDEEFRELASACQSAFDGEAAEQRCVATLATSRNAATVACADAFDGDASEQRCLETAAWSWQPPADSLRACADAFDGDAAELQCFGTMSQSWLPATAVTACQDSFDGEHRAVLPPGGRGVPASRRPAGW